MPPCPGSQPGRARQGSPSAAPSPNQWDQYAQHTRWQVNKGRLQFSTSHIRRKKLRGRSATVRDAVPQSFSSLTPVHTQPEASAHLRRGSSSAPTWERVLRFSRQFLFTERPSTLALLISWCSTKPTEPTPACKARKFSGLLLLTCAFFIRKASAAIQPQHLRANYSV